jgi:hypothetical protein
MIHNHEVGGSCPPLATLIIRQLQNKKCSCLFNYTQFTHAKLPFGTFSQKISILLMIFHRLLRIITNIPDFVPLSCFTTPIAVLSGCFIDLLKFGPLLLR